MEFTKVNESVITPKKISKSGIAYSGNKITEVGINTIDSMSVMFYMQMIKTELSQLCDENAKQLIIDIYDKYVTSMSEGRMATSPEIETKIEDEDISMFPYIEKALNQLILINTPKEFIDLFLDYCFDCLNVVVENTSNEEIPDIVLEEFREQSEKFLNIKGLLDEGTFSTYRLVHGISDIVTEYSEYGMFSPYHEDIEIEEDCEELAETLKYLVYMFLNEYGYKVTYDEVDKYACISEVIVEALIDNANEATVHRGKKAGKRVVRGGKVVKLSRRKKKIKLSTRRKLRKAARKRARRPKKRSTIRKMMRSRARGKRRGLYG